MKGLDREELGAMTMVAVGFVPVGDSPSGVIGRLVTRGLLVRTKIDCGAPGCPGHDDLSMTTLGAFVFHVVRSQGAS